MDKQEKQEKKEFISQYIDLANGRFTDDEIDELYDIATDISSYIGRSYSYDKGRYKSFDSEDTYWVTDTVTIEYIEKDGYLCIRETLISRYDDGTVNEYVTNHDTARKILNFMR